MYKVTYIEKRIQLYFTLAILQLVGNPTFSIENDVKGFKLIRFFFNEILQMSKFKLFVLQDNFSKIAQMFLKFA